MNCLSNHKTEYRTSCLAVRIWCQSKRKNKILYTILQEKRVCMAKIYDPPSPHPRQQKEQHLRQPAHARPVQSWANTFAHWGFILEKHLMQPMQQQWVHIEPQQFDAALAKISAASGCFGSSDPGGMFSEVATKLPKPMDRLGSNIGLWLSESFILMRLFFGSCYDVRWRTSQKIMVLHFINHMKLPAFTYTCNHLGNEKCSKTKNKSRK